MSERAVSREPHFEIEQFLFREASILDERRFEEWLGLVSANIRYRVACRVIREAGHNSARYVIVDDDVEALRRRVEQISNPRLTHAENPPSFTRRFVSNIRVVKGDTAGSVDVSSNLLVYRHRLEAPRGDLYVGERHDVLQPSEGGWRIAKRLVRLDHAAFAGSLTVLL